jgi:hypothetical protein
MQSRRHEKVGIYLKTSFSLILIILSGCASNPSLKPDRDSGFPAIFVNASGTGKTVEAAKDSAFREAVQQAAGVVLHSELKAEDDRLTKDLIQEYSSGYVSSYDLLSTRQTPDGYVVDINALVSGDKVASRLASYDTFGSAVKLDADQAYAKVSTLLHSRSSADSLISNLLNEYPNHALKVTVGQAVVEVDDIRRIQLKIPFTLEWSTDYINALRQTVEYIAKDGCSYSEYTAAYCRDNYDLQVGDGGYGLFSHDSKAFQLVDSKQAQTVKDAFSRPVSLKVDAKDLAGQPLIHTCMNVPTGDQKAGDLIVLNKGTVKVRIRQQPYKGVMRLFVKSAETLPSISDIDVRIAGRC